MAVGYQYRKISNYELLELKKEGDFWESNHQFALNLPENDDEEHSSITLNGYSDNPDFFKFFVKHETWKNQKARFDNIIRDSFIGIEEFHLFIPKNFTYLYADTNAKYCNELLKRVKQTKFDFSYDSHLVDLLRLKEALSEKITGGWFSKLQISNVSTAAIFGVNVSDSEEWGRYQNSGEISALILGFLYQGQKHSIQITSNGTIVLFQNFKEAYALNLIEEINNVVLKFAEDIKN